jgi:Na+/proline symporter
VQMVWDNTGDVTGEQVLRSPYTAIISVITAKGGFEKGVGVIAFTSSLAAIMSTADSLIIAISHLVTVECVWPFQKGQSNWKIAWIGRLTSLAATTLACIMGIAWQGG